ncbi:MAG: hypothetical protein AAB790_03105 [Patescibacteria group bacterium]
MKDREHEEWLENRNARRAAAKKNTAHPLIPPPKADDTKRAEEGDDQDGRVWRGEAA